MNIKKIPQEKICPIRSMYYNVYGTTITLRDEISYILMCLRETCKIIIINGYEKIFEIIYERLCIWL